MTLATPLLEKFLGVMSGLSLGTFLSNFKSAALTVFELLAFNSHDRPLHTHKHTDRHTSNERIISAIHFVYLAEIKKKTKKLYYCYFIGLITESNSLRNFSRFILGVCTMHQLDSHKCLQKLSSLCNEIYDCNHIIKISRLHKIICHYLHPSNFLYRVRNNGPGFIVSMVGLLLL